MKESFDERIPQAPRVWPLYLFVSTCIGWLFYWGLLGIDYKGVMQTAKGTMGAMFRALGQPAFDYIQDWSIDGLAYAILETIAIAIAGTFLSAFLSLPFALLASQNIVGKRLSKMGKFFITCIRVFPELILAIIFIKIVGPSALAGVLALGVHSIGMLGKLFSEAIESMDMGPVEAMEACGAKTTQKLVHAVIPQVLPAFFGFTLYRFEINMRAASTLGIVGAGGIGAPLLFAIGSRDWSKTFTIVFALIATVLLIDAFSGAIRKRFR